MKIAIASEDGMTISRHFGRSRQFFIYISENDQIVKSELRVADKGMCSHGTHVEDHTHPQHSAHDHMGMLEPVRDCDVLICGGMGAGAANALITLGIQPIVVQTDASPELVARMFVEGKITPEQSGFCSCENH